MCTPEEIAKLRWTPERACEWRKTRPWRVGCNFLPSTAINQLEMWQAETFDAATLDRELGWMAGLGMNCARIFLHDLPWLEDAKGFLDRVDQFLSIAERHGVTTLFVFFDSVWHPFPHPGTQPIPEPGVHNSGWVQSPGVRVLRDPAASALLEPYVASVVARFGNDPRVEGWDVWNEPDNENGPTYGPRDIKENKASVVLPLMVQAFGWIRAGDPTQPVTSGVWRFDGNGNEQHFPLNDFQLEASDIISFHSYRKQPVTKKIVDALKAYGRPLMCTEYMARTEGSTFEAILPYFKEEGIDAYNWGFVSGKSQTIFPWATWQGPYPPEPPLWFHDVLRPDGTPYRAEETQLIRSLTGTT